MVPKKFLEKENLVFGIVWGVLVIFLAGFLLKAIIVITLVMDTLLEWGIKVFVFPSLLVDMVGVSGLLKYGLVIIITVLAAPLARKGFNWLRRVFKKSPI